MKIYKCLNKTKTSVLWVIVLCILSGLFIFSNECKNGAISGIELCLTVLVPSLFPFFIVSAFVSESNILETIIPILNPSAKLLLGTKGICIVPVILSILGGYPIGAKSIATLYSVGSISKEEAQKLIPVCCAAGPGFLVTYIGLSMLKSYESGIILLSSQIISVIIIAVISRLTFSNSKTSSKITYQNKSTPISEALVNSVNSAVKSTAGMCGFVIAFSIICNVLTEGFNARNIIGKLIAAIFEITTGSNLLAGEVSLEVISALTGFGGFCVHMQIFRELKNISFSKTKFYIFRLLQSVICFFTTKLLLLAFPISTEVFSTVANPPRLTFYSSTIGCVALGITSVIFILALRKSSKS